MINKIIINKYTNNQNLISKFRLDICQVNQI